jgi:hypothetical protein
MECYTCAPYALQRFFSPNPFSHSFWASLVLSPFYCILLSPLSSFFFLLSLSFSLCLIFFSFVSSRCPSPSFFPLLSFPFVSFPFVSFLFYSTLVALTVTRSASVSYLLLFFSLFLCALVLCSLRSALVPLRWRILRKTTLTSQSDGYSARKQRLWCLRSPTHPNSPIDRKPSWIKFIARGGGG